MGELEKRTRVSMSLQPLIFPQPPNRHSPATARDPVIISPKVWFETRQLECSNEPLVSSMLHQAPNTMKQALAQSRSISASKKMEKRSPKLRPQISSNGIETGQWAQKQL